MQFRGKKLFKRISLSLKHRLLFSGICYCTNHIIMRVANGDAYYILWTMTPQIWFLWTVYGIGNHTIIYIYIYIHTHTHTQENYGSRREKRKHGQIKYYISLIGVPLCCSALFSPIRLKGKLFSRQVLIPTYLSIWLGPPWSYQHLASPRSSYYLRLYSVIYLQQYLAFAGWEAVFKPKPPMAHQFSRII